MSDSQLPEGSLIEVKMTVRLPAAATDEQISEWLEAEVANSGGIDRGNPLSDHAPEAFGAFGLDWEDTGQTGREEQYDYEDLGGGNARWRVRYITERRP